MKKVDSSPSRVLDVIDSCKTGEQLLVARNYMLLWLRRYGKWETPLYGTAFSIFALDHLKLLELKETRREKAENHHPENR